MKNISATAASLLALAATPFGASEAIGQDRKSQTVSPAGSQFAVRGPAQYFTGNVGG